MCVCARAHAYVYVEKHVHPKKVVEKVCNIVLY